MHKGNRMKTSRYILIALLFYSLAHAGYSMVGAGIGLNATDDKVFMTNSKENEFINLIDSTKTIKIITKDNTIIKGEFIDYIKLPNDEEKGNLSAISHLFVRVNVNSVILTFPLEYVKEIIVKDYNYNWLVGLLAGAAVDALIIYEIKNNLFSNLFSGYN